MLNFSFCFVTICIFLERLEDCRETFGGLSGDCWGTFWELLGNFWGAVSELVQHFFGTYNNTKQKMLLARAQLDKWTSREQIVTDSDNRA